MKVKEESEVKTSVKANRCKKIHIYVTNPFRASFNDSCLLASHIELRS